MLDNKTERVIVKKIGILIQNQNNLWEWEN